MKVTSVIISGLSLFISGCSLALAIVSLVHKRR